MTRDEETSSWPEYKNLVLDKFEKLENNVDKMLELQATIREDNVAVKQEIRTLHRSYEDLRSSQHDLEDSMTELSKAMANLASSVSNVQSNCENRRETSKAVYRQINDSETGVLRRLSRTEERVAYLTRSHWIVAAALATLFFDLLRKRLGF